MFILVCHSLPDVILPLRSQTTISDLVQITPEDFQKPSAEAIEDNLNEKYANKVAQIGRLNNA